MADEKVSILVQLIDKVSGAAKGITSSLKDMLTSINPLTIGMAGLTAAIGYTIKAAEESRRIMAQTNAVLKSTGYAAGVTATQISSLATEFSEMTNFDDEAVQSAENLILTFTNINKKIFPETTAIVLDMSAALGQDFKSSAIQVGKALQDPITGLTALRRVGVNFTDAQKDQIKAMVESGRVMEAQKVILKELETEFGGSAKAQASGIKILRNALQNLAEDTGGIFLPKIDA